MSTRALVIEDDHATSSLLRFHLEREGFSCRVEADGDVGLGLCESLQPDLLLVDQMLPSRSGISICQTVRSWDIVQPVILLVSALRDEVDVVAGLSSGADDYVRKPFGVAELIARCRRLLQAPRIVTPAPRGVLCEDDVPTLYDHSSKFFQKHQDAPPEVECSLAIDFVRRAVHIEGHRLQLTPSEFHLLFVFSQRPREVLSREELLDCLWGFDSACYSRTIDAHICRLRKKLEAAGMTGHPIETVHGRGYRFRAKSVRLAS
jgi:DNA-binding response OmpR family regulator